MKKHSPKRPISYEAFPSVPAREKKLARLQREIEQGTYQVDLKKLTDILMIKLLLPCQNPPIFRHALTDSKRLPAG